jgi:carbamoyltransferase
MFWALQKVMAQAAGNTVLVNTSFNSLQEPIVCTPRDAVRVFHGTGLDVLVCGGSF